MENLHLYKPGASPIYSERLLTLLPDSYLRNVTVHENFYLKKEYDLAGIHLDDPTQEKPYGYKGRIGRTCNELALLPTLRKQSDYVFLKNIFDSIEFPTEHSNFNMKELEEAARHGLFGKRVYAMGGMSIDTIKMAKDLGFGGVVICGDLWSKFDIHQQKDFKDTLSYFSQLQKAVD